MNTKLEKLTQELALPQYKELIDKQDYPAIAFLLNQKPLIPNPEQQQQVPRIPTEENANNLYNLLTPQEKNTIAKIPGMYERLMVSFSTGDIIRIQQAYQAIQIDLSLDSQKAIEEFLTEILTSTQPDPNYQSEILGQSKAEQLGITINEYDIQAALNSNGILLGGNS